MGYAAALNAVGELGLCASAYFTALRTPGFLFLSAIVKGFGGGFSVLEAAQSAFIAENAAFHKRSFYLGLANVMAWGAGAFAPLVSAALLKNKHYVASFGVSAGCWVVYLLYLVFILRETQPPPPASILHDELAGAEFESGHSGEALSVARRTFESFVRSIFDPLLLLMGNSTLRWLGILDSMMVLGLGAFGVIIVYCDRIFGLSPSEAGVISAAMAGARAFSVLCVLPAFIAVYQRFFSPYRPIHLRRNSSQSHQAEDVTPLLDEVTAGEINAEVDAYEQGKLQEVSAAQELLICRISFAIDALGMFLISLSRNRTGILISTTIGSLGAPNAPSLQALVTLAAPPAELGRILAGFTILESAASTVRNPLMLAVYSATLERYVGAVWWFAAVLFLSCAIILSFLRPARFGKAVEI